MASHLLLIPNVERTPALAEALRSRAMAVAGAEFSLIVRVAPVERLLPWEGNVGLEVAQYTAESVADYMRAGGISIGRSRAGAGLRAMLEEELRDTGAHFESVIVPDSRPRAACSGSSLAKTLHGRLPLLRVQAPARAGKRAAAAAIHWLTGHLEATKDDRSVAADLPLESIDFWSAVLLLVAQGRSSGQAVVRGRSLLSAETLPQAATSARSSAALVALLMSQDRRVRRLAVGALGSGPQNVEKTAARRALQDSDVEVRIDALRVLAAPVLAREGVTHTTTTMARVLSRPIGPLRATKAGGVDVATLSLLAATLRSRSTEARWLAACCLARYRDPAVLPALSLALQDESPAVSMAAADGLLALGPRHAPDVWRGAEGATLGDGARAAPDQIEGHTLASGAVTNLRR